MLVLSHTVREVHMSRDSHISPAEFGLYNKHKEINFAPKSENKFLGIAIDPIKMTLSLTPEYVQKVVKTFQNLLTSHSTTLPELIRVVGLLSTIQAVEPANIQLRFLQQQQIVGLREKMNYQSVITLNTKSRTELTWWIENLRFCNGRTFFQLRPQIIIQTNASLTGWGAVCNGVRTSGQWSEEERTLLINVLELLAIKLALLALLHQREKGESHTLSDRHQGSLVLPFENGGDKERAYDQIEQRDLALSSKSQYAYHNRIPAFSTEYSSRLGIKKKPDPSE